MAHLVAQVVGPTEVSALRVQLEEAHGFLVAAAKAVVHRLDTLDAENWGTVVKRQYVILTDGRPPLVREAANQHSFAEVVNQCATLERLMDVIRWAERWPELEGAKVVGCHPTTSSGSAREDEHKRDDDHDLVLVDRSGVRWMFEVSDVASEQDGNGKERKDLASLGIPTSDQPHDWPTGRRFLVVSTEFAARLRKPTRHGLRLKLFHYVEQPLSSSTHLFEICRGPRPSAVTPPA